MIPQLYALMRDDPVREVAYLDLGREEGLGQLLGIAVYTAPDGPAQRKHLEEEYATTKLVVAPVSHEALLEAVNRAMPVTVFYDGRKIAGSVMQGMLKDALGLPIRHPRILDSERVFGPDEQEEEEEPHD